MYQSVDPEHFPIAIAIHTACMPQPRLYFGISLYAEKLCCVQMRNEWVIFIYCTPQCAINNLKYDHITTFQVNVHCM